MTETQPLSAEECCPTCGDSMSEVRRHGCQSYDHIEEGKSCPIRQETER